MSVEVTGSTVPRRQLGRYLRELRNRQRLTIRAAAGQLEWSEAKMWRIETGQTSLRSLDVEAMCKIYGAPADLTQALMGLAKETKARGWWQAYGDVIPEGFDVYIGLEEAASQLAWYEQSWSPGILQTEGYARTLIEADNPDMGEEEISRRVHVRMARQPLIRRATAPVQLQVALNEAILRRPVGGPQIMAGQLDQLVQVSGVAERVAAGRPVQRRGSSGGDVGPVCHPAVPGSAGTGGKLNPRRSTRTGSPARCTWTSRRRWSGTRGRSAASRTACLDEDASRSLIQQAAEELRT